MNPERELWLEMLDACRAEAVQGRDDCTGQGNVSLGKGPDCPFAGDLIELALGGVSLAQASNLLLHLRGCDYCRACYAGYQKAAARNRPQEPDPPAVAGPAAGDSGQNDPTEFDPATQADYVDLVRRLRPYVPALLGAVGLDTAQEAGFIAYIERTGTRMPGTPLNELLTQFASSSGQGLPRPADPDVLAAAICGQAVLVVRDHGEKAPSDQLEEFRQQALKDPQAVQQRVLAKEGLSDLQLGGESWDPVVRQRHYQWLQRLISLEVEYVLRCTGLPEPRPQGRVRSSLDEHEFA